MRQALLWVVTLTILTIATSACDDSGSVGQLHVGSCFELPEQTADTQRFEMSSLNYTSCDSPHDAEVYATYELSRGTVSEFSLAACERRFEEAVGKPLLQAEFQVSLFGPTWTVDDESTDRTVSCFVTAADGQTMTGSILPDG